MDIQSLKDESFARGFIACETDNITKKVAAGQKKYMEEGKFRIDPKTGFPFCNYVDDACYFYFSSAVECNQETLNKKIEADPEHKEEYLYIKKYLDKYSFWRRMDMFRNDFDRAFADERGCGWGGSWLGHAVPNFIDFAKYGTDGLREKVTGYMKKNPDKSEFYDAMFLVLDGLDTLGKRVHDAAVKLADAETDAKTKSKYERLANTFSRCPKAPAETFSDACLVYVLVYNMDGKDSPGYFDQYMIDFWRRSDEAERQEMLDDIWEFFHDTRTWNVCIGGSDENWNDKSNELTYAILEEVKRTKYQTPNLTLRCHRNTPESIYRAAAESIGTGTGIPALYNDEAVCPALENLGIPPKDSHLYVMNGCNQIDIQGKSHMGLEDGEVNLGRAVEFTLSNGRDQKNGTLLGAQTGDPRDFETFDDFYQAFTIQMHAMIHEVVSLSNKSQKAASEVVGNPMRSLTIKGCLEKGLDHKNHGPLYGHGQILIEGLADTVDSVAAVKKYVYDEKLFTIGELVDALNANFEGYDEIYRVLKKSDLRFGNDIDYVDEIAKKIVDDFNSYLLDIPTFRGGFFSGGCSPFNRAAGNGRHAGALPSGKKRGESMYADSIGAVPGKDINGPTALLKSCLRFNHKLPGSGFILNIKFSKNAFNTETGMKSFIDLWKTYFSNCGQQLSVTVVNRDELLDAQVNPDEHRNLIVRVGGYSEYFVNLPEDLQENVIARTDY